MEPNGNSIAKNQCLDFLVDLYSSKEDYIKDVWKLSNVQPLKRSENASKCNRYESI